MAAERHGIGPGESLSQQVGKVFPAHAERVAQTAYYDPIANTYYDYPTSSNSIPDGIDFPGDPSFDAVFTDGGDNGGPNSISNVGLLSPYKTLGQGGNIAEWTE